VQRPYFSFFSPPFHPHRFFLYSLIFPGRILLSSSFPLSQASTLDISFQRYPRRFIASCTPRSRQVDFAEAGGDFFPPSFSLTTFFSCNVPFSLVENPTKVTAPLAPPLTDHHAPPFPTFVDFAADGAIPPFEPNPSVCHFFASRNFSSGSWRVSVPGPRLTPPLPPATNACLFFFLGVC